MYSTHGYLLLCPLWMGQTRPSHTWTHGHDHQRSPPLHQNTCSGPLPPSYQLYHGPRSPRIAGSPAIYWPIWHDKTTPGPKYIYYKGDYDSTYLNRHKQQVLTNCCSCCTIVYPRLLCPTRQPMDTNCRLQSDIVLWGVLEYIVLSTYSHFSKSVSTYWNVCFWKDTSFSKMSWELLSTCDNQKKNHAETVLGGAFNIAPFLSPNPVYSWKTVDLGRKGGEILRAPPKTVLAQF